MEIKDRHSKEDSERIRIVVHLLSSDHYNSRGSEAQRTQWQAIKRATKGSGMMNVTRVEVEQENGSVMEYTSKEDIEYRRSNDGRSLQTFQSCCLNFNMPRSIVV